MITMINLVVLVNFMRIRYFCLFQDALRDNPSVTWLVEFYAPWCPPCVRFAPTFAELSLR